MNFSNFFSEIEDIQRRLKSMDNDRLHRELQFFVQFDQWRSPLIYGSLYISRVGTPPVLAFFARKTIEILGKVCEQRIDKDNKTLMKDQSTGEKEEFQLSKKLLDQLLISIAILVFASDLKEQREVIASVEKAIEKKIRDNRSRFIDKLSLDNYLKLLEHRFRQNEGAFKPLGTFFYDLIKNAGLDKAQGLGQQTAKFKRYIDLLIEESGGRIEKPDRIFSYADCLDTVIQFAQSLFDSGKIQGKEYFSKHKWDYLWSKSFDELRVFWVTCMTGLFTFAQSFDRFIILPEINEKVF